MEKARQHVVPKHDGGWTVRRDGASRASRVFETQLDAMTYARDLARKAGTELFIHSSDGMVTKRESYKREPSRPMPTPAR